MRLVNLTEQTFQTHTEYRNNFFEQVFDYCLKIFLVLGTLFYLAPQQPIVEVFKRLEWGYMVNELFFRGGVMLLFGLSLMIEPKRRLVSKELACFLAYMFLFSMFIQYGINSRRIILNVFFGLAFYKTVYEYLDISKVKTHVFWLFWLLVANLVLCLFQLAKTDLIFVSANQELMPHAQPVGFMRLESTLGVLAAIIAPLLSVFNPFLGIVALPLLFFSRASTAVLAFAVYTAFYIYRRVNKLWFSLGAVIAFGAVAAYVLKIDMPGLDLSIFADQRFSIWLRSADFFLKTNPLFGMGAGTFAQWMPTTNQLTSADKLSWIWTHNEYLQGFFEFGIFGMVPVFLFLKARVLEFKFVNSKSLDPYFGSFLSVLIVSFFHFPFHLGSMAGLCVYVMALFHLLTREKITESL